MTNEDIEAALKWLEGSWQAADNRSEAARAARVIRMLRGDHEPSAHVHSDACWEPDSGCDMGRNEAFATPAGSMGACEHLRSEFLAASRSDQEPFEMRKCLDCKRIFRKRLSVRTTD